MTEDVSADRFLQLAAQARSREITMTNIEVKLPNSKRRIEGAYRVTWRVVPKLLRQGDLIKP